MTTTSTQRQFTPEQQRRLAELIKQQMDGQMVMGTVVIDGR